MGGAGWPDEGDASTTAGSGPSGPSGGFGDEKVLVLVGQLDNGLAEAEVDSSSQVNGAKHLNGEIRVHLPYELCSIAGGDMGFPVQVGRDIAIGIENGLVPAELDDLANDHHIPTHVRVQVGTGYTGGRLHCVLI